MKKIFIIISINYIVFFSTSFANINLNYIVNKSAKVLESFEGIKYQKYKGLGKKEQAICYGNSFSEYRARFKTKVATKHNCNILLKEKIMLYFMQLEEENLNLNNNQYVALISLIYNLRNNYGAFVETNLYQHIKYNQNEFYLVIPYIIYEWLDINRVQHKTNCGLLLRRAKEIKIYYKSFNTKENKYAYKTLKKILKEYSKEGVCTQKINNFLKMQYIKKPEN